MRFTTATVVGIPSKTTWSTTAVIRLPVGEVFCACGFSGDDSAPHEGRRLIRELESLRAHDLRQVYEFLQSLVSNLPNSVAASIAVTVVQSSQIMIMTFGYGQVGLVRPKQNPRWLVDGQKPQVTLQGKVEVGDQFVLATARGQELGLLGVQPLPAQPDEWPAALFAQVQTHSHSGEISVLIVQAESGDTSAAPEPALPTDPFGERTPFVVHSAQDSQSDSDGSELEAADEAVSSQSDVSSDAAALFEATSPVHSVASRQHLISPDRLAQGIEAAHDVVEPSGAKWSPKRFSPGSLAGGATNIAQRVKSLRLGRIVAVLVVFGVIIFSIVSYRAWNVRQEHERVVVPLQALVAQVEEYDESQRFQQRSEAESLLERLNATRVSYAPNRRSVQQMVVQIETIYNHVSGEKNVVNLPVFYDFRLVSSDFLATRASFESGIAVFLDASKKRLITLRLDTKQNEAIPVDVDDTLLDVSLSGQKLTVLGSKGLWEASVSGGTFTNVREWGSTVTSPQSLSRFGESRYVLDRGEQQIWRLDTDDEGRVASPSAWVRSARGIDFSEVDSVSINGSIWLGSQSGDVYKLTRGEREAWDIVGLPEAFTSTVLVASSVDGARLAIVEPAQKRVVIADKDSAEYLQQITSEQIGAVTDVFWNDDESVLYLLSGSVVYKVDVE